MNRSQIMSTPFHDLDKYEPVWKFEKVPRVEVPEQINAEQLFHRFHKFQRCFIDFINFNAVSEWV